jgi:hypothetical protein
MFLIIVYTVNSSLGCVRTSSFDLLSCAENEFRISYFLTITKRIKLLLLPYVQDNFTFSRNRRLMPASLDNDKEEWSRVGAVALYTVLWTVFAKYIGNGDFQHLTEQKPLNRSIQKFEQFITSAGPQSRPKFIMIGRGVSAPHIGEIYGSRSFFPVTCWANAQPTPNARAPHMLYTNRRGSGQGCVFWGLIDTSHPLGELSPKNRSFWGRQWGFPA